MRIFKSRIDDSCSDWALARWSEPGEFDSFCFLRTPWFEIKINFHTEPNPVREMHDHPWSFIAFVLKGSYTEVSGTVDGDRLINTHYRHVDYFTKRRHDDPHGIVGIEPGGCITLMFTGPYRRKCWLYYDCLDTPGRGDVRFMKRLP